MHWLCWMPNTDTGRASRRLLSILISATPSSRPFTFGQGGWKRIAGWRGSKQEKESHSFARAQPIQSDRRIDPPQQADSPWPLLQVVPLKHSMGGSLRSPMSVESLEELGRVRLSPSFFMRDFLYSEIGNFYGVANIPENPDLAIENGKRLCEELLEPLQSTFGRIAIRSAYRSPKINALGNEKGHNCGSNEKNFARHILGRAGQRRSWCDGMCRRVLVR